MLRLDQEAETPPAPAAEATSNRLPATADPGATLPTDETGRMPEATTVEHSAEALTDDLAADALVSTDMDSDAVVADDCENSRNVVDFDRALPRVGGTMTALRALALVLHGECPKLLKELAQAIRSENAPEIQRTAHTLKGSSRHFFADEVVEAAATMEALGRDAQFAESKALYPQLKQAVFRLMEAIDERFHDPPEPQQTTET